MKQIKHGMVKNPFWQEFITSWLNVQPWPLSSTHDSQETTSGQSSALSDQEITKHDYHKSFHIIAFQLLSQDPFQRFLSPFYDTVIKLQLSGVQVIGSSEQITRKWGKNVFSKN